jgi:hypothetical protein
MRWVVSFRFNPGERAPGTHWIGVWVDSRAGLDFVGKEKILAPTGIRNPTSFVVQPDGSRYTGVIQSALATLAICKTVIWLDESRNGYFESDKTEFL